MGIKINLKDEIGSKNKRLRALILSTVNRYVWVRDSQRAEVVRRCVVDVEVGVFKNGKTKYKRMYKCEGCADVFEKLDVHHIEPRIDPLVGWVSMDNWIDRTFVSAEKLQGLCEGCHDEVTHREARAANKE